MMLSTITFSLVSSANDIQHDDFQPNDFQPNDMTAKETDQQQDGSRAVDFHRRIPVLHDVDDGPAETRQRHLPPTPVNSFYAVKVNLHVRFQRPILKAGAIWT
jgi:hypothetical protein